MNRRQPPSVRSTLLGAWSLWWRLVEWGAAFGGSLSRRIAGGSAGLTRASRTRVIELIEGDLDLLVEDASEKAISEQSVEEILRNRELLVWLRGGPVAGRGAVELLEDNVAIFYGVSAGVEQANGHALRAALDELVRAQAAADASSSSGDEGEEAATETTERERHRFGRKLDELREWRSLTVGELSARSGVDVVSVVGLIHGAEEAASLDLMRLAAALEVLPRDLFPECLAGGGDDQGHGGIGGDA